MKASITIGALLLISACSSTGVVPMDQGTYMIGKKSAQAGFGPPNGVKADVYREANEFCENDGKTVKTVDLDVVDSGFARPGSVELIFSCE